MLFWKFIQRFCFFFSERDSLLSALASLSLIYQSSAKWSEGNLLWRLLSTRAYSRGPNKLLHASVHSGSPSRTLVHFILRTDGESVVAIEPFYLRQLILVDSRTLSLLSFGLWRKHWNYGKHTILVAFVNCFIRGYKTSGRYPNN